MASNNSLFIKILGSAILVMAAIFFLLPEKSIVAPPEAEKVILPLHLADTMFPTLPPSLASWVAHPSGENIALTVFMPPSSTDSARVAATLSSYATKGLFPPKLRITTLPPSLANFAKKRPDTPWPIIFVYTKDTVVFNSGQKAMTDLPQIIRSLSKVPVAQAASDSSAPPDSSNR